MDINSFDLTKPVSPQMPCGEDLRYDGGYEKIEQAVNSQNNIHATVKADWPALIPQIEHLLAWRTRDLRLLSWLSFARYQRDGLSGLNQTLSIITELCETFWGQLFPLRSKAKLSAFKWLSEQLHSTLPEKIAQETDDTQAALLLLNLKTLEALSDRQFNTQHALFLPLIRELKKIIARGDTKSRTTTSIASNQLSTSNEALAMEVNKKVCQPARLSHNTQEIPAPLQITAAEKQLTHSDFRAETGENNFASAEIHRHVTVTKCDTFHHDSEVTVCCREIQKKTEALSFHWLTEDLTDQRSYLLNRAVAWLKIQGLPGHTDNLITQLKPVSIERVAAFNDLFQQEKYTQLLPELELVLLKMPFWLDGHHMSWQCLCHLNHQKTAADLSYLLCFLLKRLPQLVTLKFDNGEPFASEATRSWIQRSVIQKLSDRPLQSDTVSSAESDCAIPASERAPEKNNTVKAGTDNRLTPWESALPQALAIAKNSSHSQGALILQQGVNTAANGRERCYWKLTLAQFCLAIHQEELAHTLLLQLDKELAQHNIAQWEPRIQIQLLEIQLDLYQSKPELCDDHQRDTAKEKLCRLNICSVLSK